MTRREALTVAAASIFAAQASASFFLRRDPFMPSPPPLAALPLELGGWTQVVEETIAPEALEALGPDDFLARVYQQPATKDRADLFVAYYKTQLRTKNAHDPKVCLPGSGWNPIDSRQDVITIPDSGHSFPVNYYRIRKDDTEQLVLYWFQTRKGVYTFEQQLRVHRLWDAVVDNRTDMALVRIIVPVNPGSFAVAENNARRVAQLIYTQMLAYFPPAEKAVS